MLSTIGIATQTKDRHLRRRRCDILMIIDINDEQFALIQKYRSRWQQGAFSLDPIDRSLVTETLNTAYLLAESDRPTLFFFESPRQAIEELGFPINRTPIALVNIAGPIIQQVRAQFLPILWTRLWRRLGRVHANAMGLMVANSVQEMLPKQFGLTRDDPILRTIETQGSAISDMALLDFCIEVLGCTHTEPERWQSVQGLIQNCFWHMAFEDICIVFERPLRS
jgi:hypothetical protein